MNASRYCFLGAARDCASHLGELRRQLDRVPGEWKAWFLETNSSDDTRAVLEAWANDDSRIHLIEERDYPAPSGHDMRLRTHRLAVYRNALRDAWISDEKPGDVVVVLDTDDVVGDVPSFLQACKSHPTPWDALFPRTTYDWWALRVKGASWNLWELTALSVIGKVNAGMISALRKALKRAAATAPLRVLSAFNGIGVYKADVYKKGTYSGQNRTHSGVSHVWKAALPPCFCGDNRCQRCYCYQRFNEECEHVNMHQSLGPQAMLQMLPHSYE